MNTQIQTLTNSHHTALVVDHVFSDPAALRQRALTSHFSAPSSNYPGLRAPAEVDSTLLNMLLAKHSVRPVSVVKSWAYFSRIDPRVMQLSPNQTIPHVDGGVIAGTAYLNLPETCSGGTAFYRHRASSEEWLGDPESRFISRINAFTTVPEAAAFAGLSFDPEHWLRESNSVWELIGLAAMRFNRLVMYDGRIFHGAYIQNRHVFGDAERLTYNVFAELGDPAPPIAWRVG